MHTDVTGGMAGEAEIPCLSHSHLIHPLKPSSGRKQSAETVPEKLALTSLGNLPGDLCAHSGGTVRLVPVFSEQGLQRTLAPAVAA